MLERLFVLFHHSRNIPCVRTRDYTVFVQLWFINLCILNLHIWSHTSFSSYPPTKLTTNLPKQSSIHWHNCARGSESFGLEIIMAPSLDVALVTMGWNPFSLIYNKIFQIACCYTLSMCVWVSNAQWLLLAKLSQL